RGLAGKCRADAKPAWKIVPETQPSRGLACRVASRAPYCLLRHEGKFARTGQHEPRSWWIGRLYCGGGKHSLADVPVSIVLLRGLEHCYSGKAAAFSAEHRGRISRRSCVAAFRASGSRE